MRIQINIRSESTHIVESPEMEKSMDLEVWSTPKMRQFGTIEAELTEKVLKEVRRAMHYIMGVDHEG